MKLALITSVGFFALAFATGCATAVGTEGGDAGPSPASKDGGTSDSGPAKKDAGSSSTQDDSGTITPTDDAGQPLDDTACSNLTTKGQCEQCCLKVHPSGYDVYHQALERLHVHLSGRVRDRVRDRVVREQADDLGRRLRAVHHVVARPERRLLQPRGERVPGRHRLHRALRHVHPAVRKQISRRAFRGIVAA